MTTEGPPIRRLADWDAATLRDLADEYGTPLYVLDRRRVRENVANLRAAFHDEAISYAVKANTVRATLETVAETDLGAECASAGELQRAIDAGFDRVRYTAVNPPADDLDRVVELAADPPRDLELVITVGAADTFEALAERGYDGPLAIRVNPGVGAGHHAKVTTGDAPKFGVPYDRVPELADEIADRGFDLVGLHAHAGSGIHEASDLAAHRELVSRMGKLARDLDHDLDFLNVGGGLGVPYRPDEEPLDLDSVAAATREAVGELDATLGIEPGRYVVADAGVLLTTVNTVKPTPETTVVGVDAGMTTLVRPAMYDAYHEIRTLAPDADERGSVAATIAGPICETADVLGRDRELPGPERGDVLAIGNAGAYGYEMASNYNSRPRPAVVSLEENGRARLAVERETLSELTRLEVER
ncbi:diaminopimelate decarboxylase [Halapricum desulfuricans]|uniref:Diaminopimelate decarboxylase n=1 Tax=Halapricum desulfuricans TaxID=2841257 RepID=A0A897N7V3_9EURY|nr:diaminopimelate decarboxylase [Halapricum desulfuricans]QSG07225.1 Diaminopimelate decarboxylase [Halapricum desulfuricans]